MSSKITWQWLKNLLAKTTSLATAYSSNLLRARKIMGMRIGDGTVDP